MHGSLGPALPSMARPSTLPLCLITLHCTPLLPGDLNTLEAFDPTLFSSS